MKTKFLLFALFCLGFMNLTIHAQNYGEVLQKSLFFYEGQQAGYLSENNRATWRAESVTADGSDVGLDLSSGWFDAGDHVKFNFPMAYSVTTLCWGYLENEAAYEAAGQTEIFLENIKYTTDYLINCHSGTNELYGQVGDGSEDHSYWVSAEIIEISSDRPSYKIDADNPGSDLAGETAAALAAASMVFKSSNPSYSAELLSHAIDLYDFADNYRGSYSDVLPVSAFYNSWSGYQDEIVWGAIWLYKATEDATYLTKAESEYDNMNVETGTTDKSYGWTLAWDDKSYGNYVLMAEITGEATYFEDAERFLDQWFTSSSSDGKGPSFTDSGFPILDSWGSNRYAANTAFLLQVHSDNMTDATKQTNYRERAKEIMDYMLGDNPQNTSYVIGYGDEYPMYPHHRTAHGSWARSESLPVETRHILYGALVGGHKTASDYSWTDDRSDYVWNEVACDYNSLFTGVAARLYADYGGEPVSGFPVEETPNGEFSVDVKLNGSGNTYTEYAINAHNRTSWPARIPSFKLRIFIDISEGVEAGYSLTDYVVSANTSNAEISDLTAWDADNYIYYVEAEFTEDIYPGGQSESYEETQIRIRLPYDADTDAWDASNDWSATNISSTSTETDYIPLYADGELAFGTEPGPIEVIDVTGVSVSPDELDLAINQSGILTATVSPANATDTDVSWSSSNESVVTVNNDGTLTAVSVGSATITATTVDGGFTSSCAVTVSTINVEAVSVSPESLTLNKGQTSTLVASVSPTNASNTDITWSSSDESVATVGSTGIVTAIAEGSATITVTTEDGELTADCDVTITDIVLPTYTLDVTTVGDGTVSLSPSGGTYDEGQEVSLTATAGSGYVFSEWTGDVTGTSSTITITMDADKAVEAVFVESGEGCSSYADISLSFELDGVGEYCWETSGTIQYINSWNVSELSINGVDVANNYTESFPAKIDGKYQIRYVSTVSWSHVEIIGTDDSETTTTYSLVTSVVGEGSASPASGIYDEGEVVELTASPSSGYEFTAWSGDISSTDANVSITMDADKSVTATFTEIDDIENPEEYTLTVVTVGDGTVSISPDSDVYEEGTTVTLTATAASGNKFSAWSGDISSTSATTTVTMDADKSVTATFTGSTTDGDCDFNTPLATSLPTINSSFDYVHVIGSGPDLSNVTNFTINWNLENNGLYQFSMNTNDGNPNWWNDLNASITQNFSSVAPAASLSGTGFADLDGDYYAAIDDDNFVLEEQSGAYILYFSNSETAPCSISSTAKGVSGTSFAQNSELSIYPNPATKAIRVEGLSDANSITIISLVGQQVYEQEINGETELDLAVDMLSIGTYIVNVRNNSGISNSKLLIIK